MAAVAPLTPVPTASPIKMQDRPGRACTQLGVAATAVLAPLPEIMSSSFVAIFRCCDGRRNNGVTGEKGRAW